MADSNSRAGIDHPSSLLPFGGSCSPFNGGGGSDGQEHERWIGNVLKTFTSNMSTTWRGLQAALLARQQSLSMSTLGNHGGGGFTKVATRTIHGSGGFTKVACPKPLNPPRMSRTPKGRCSTVRATFITRSLYRSAKSQLNRARVVARTLFILVSGDAFEFTSGSGGCEDVELVSDDAFEFTSGSGDAVEMCSGDAVESELVSGGLLSRFGGMPEDQQTGKVFNLPSRNMLEQIYRTKLDELKSRVRQRYEEESQLIDGFRAIPEAERVILTLPEAARFLDSDEAGIQSLMDRGAVHFVPITWGVLRLHGTHWLCSRMTERTVKSKSREWWDLYPMERCLKSKSRKWKTYS